METPPTVKIPLSIDSDILGSTHTRAVGVSIPVGFQHKYMETHVLLAACSQDQYAQEASSPDGFPCGLFTDNLIRQLRLIELNRVTYVDLLSMLPKMKSQTPQCEGENKRRLLFNGKAVIGDPKVFKLVETQGLIKVNAGSIHGVTVGTEFVAQALDATTNSSKDLGNLVAFSVDIDSSTLDYCPTADKFDIPGDANAVVSNWNNDGLRMKVAVDLESDHPLTRALFPEGDLTQSELRQILESKFIKVHTGANPDIVVKPSANDGELIIERMDTLITKYASITTKFNAPGRVDRFRDIFDAISRFNYHLTQHPDEDPLEQLVSMELHKLNVLSNNGLLAPQDNIFVDNEARVIYDEEARYGLSIVNRSKYDLFPYLFYFHPSDYSILVRCCRRYVET